MARKPKPTKTGLYYAREARGLSRTELVERSGVSKQQLSRLENGQIRMRLDHLKPFAGVLGYTPEQILLWGRYPGTGSIEDAGKLQSVNPGPGDILELDARPRQGRPVAPAEPESWSFPRTLWPNGCTPRRRSCVFSKSKATPWRQQSWRGTAW